MATAMGSSREARERVAGRMAPTLRASKAPRTDTRTDSVALRLSILWGCSARRARERYDRVFRDAADVISGFMAAGQSEQLAAKMAPMDAALNAWKAPLASPLAHRNSAKADTAEDYAEVEYHLNPCRETARALVKASASERLHAEQREAALISEWEL